MLCHNTGMTTSVIFGVENVISLTMTVSAMCFLIVIFIWKAIKSRLKESYDKQNLTPEVLSYKMTSCVRSCM